jgi:hypothetical protein
MAFAKDPSEHGRVYCATYNRGLWRSEDAGETWLPVGTPEGFFEGPVGGAIEPRETTFVIGARSDRCRRKTPAGLRSALRFPH